MIGSARRGLAPWCLLLLGLAGMAAEADRPIDDKAPIAWRVEPNQLLRYRVSSWPIPKGIEGRNATTPAGLPGQRFPALDRALGKDGRGVFLYRRSWLPMVLGLQLPAQRVRKGRGFRLTRGFARMADLRPIEVQLQAKSAAPCEVDGLLCRNFKLRGVVKDVSSKADKRKYAVRSGQLRGEMQFHERGHVIAGRIDVIWDLIQPKDKKAAPRRERRRYQYQLDLVLGLKNSRLDTLVEEAIAEGVKYLKKKQGKAGNWKSRHSTTYPGGQAALGALALLSSDVKSGDAKVKAAMKIALASPLKKVYSVGVTLMAIEAMHSPSAEALEKMAPAQQAEVLAKLPARMSADERQYVSEATEWMLESTDRGRRWGYPLKSASYSYDNSCSQYAALALLSARRLGAKVPLSIWNEIVDHWLEQQDTSGKSVAVVDQGTTSVGQQQARGWNYRRSSRGSGGAYGSMTCAGVASLAIARSELIRAGQLAPSDKRRVKVDEGIRDGLAWLSANLQVDQHPGHKENHWHYYYLYGLERAGVLSDTRLLGARDWYREGAAWLVGRRRDGRGWEDEANSTCFALLFLKRATRPLVTLSK